jgi:hypothetical protein
MSAPSDDQKLPEVIWPAFVAFMKAKLPTLAKSSTDLTPATLTVHTSFLGTLCGHIERLDREVAELKAAPLEYCGVYEVGRTYRKNQFVTFGGGVWHCNEQTNERPTESDTWRLAVKRGRDAR